MQSYKTPKHSDIPELIGKGTYGCTFYPSINACNGKQEDDIDSEHYITKIQKHSSSIEEEIKIGKKIQQLHLYDHYFAPIIKYCTINTVNMDYNLVRNCPQIQNEFGEFDTGDKYLSNKIRYVGKRNLVQHLLHLKKTPAEMYRKLLNTHLYLLDATEKILQENIVHFDLKPQNIMYDDIQNVPIIIDFGISKEITPITHSRFDVTKNPDTVRKIFISDESYGYWCIDIFILSNIGTTSFLHPYEKVSVQKVAKLLKQFFTPFLLQLISSEEVIKFKQQMLQYFKTYIDKHQTWQHIFRDLVQHYPTWDNYSLAVSYLFADMKCSPPTKDEGKREPYTETIESYLSILLEIILSTPDKRPTIEETRHKIISITQHTAYLPQKYTSNS